MKKTVFIWVCILTPLTILAVYIGENMTTDAAAIAVGAGLGLFACLVGGMLIVVIRDIQDDRANRRRAAERRNRQPDIQDGHWREIPPAAPHVEPGAPRVAIEAPAATRALVPVDRTRRLIR